MTFRSATLATLEQLRNADWFARVGLDAVEGKKITVPITIVPSWKEAVKHCRSRDWDWLLNENTNIYCERLAEASSNEFGSWNDRIDGVKEVSEPLVESKIAPIRHVHNLPSSVDDTLRWIVLMTLMEAEYAHVIEPGYNTKLSFWIVNGHFPCGWKGEFPNGNLVIY